MAPQRPAGRSSDRLQAAVAAILTVGILAAVAGAVVLLASWRDVPSGPVAGGTGSGGAAGLASVGTDSTGTGTATGGAIATGAYILETPQTAPALRLIDADGSPFSIASLRGRQVLVFFGYTHCADVCPATIGTLGEVLAAVGPGSRALFVSIDPERDTPAWLKEYSPYLPDGISALTGTPDDIRTTADAWGVRFARVETGDPTAYSMSHTGDVFLVDVNGMLRARFPFGTEALAIENVLRDVAAATAAVPPPTPAVPTAGPTSASTPSVGVEAIRPEIISTSVWARTRAAVEARSPVILALNDAAGPIADPRLIVAVDLADPAGKAVGDAVTATAVQPPGENRILYVVDLDLPAPGHWRLDVTATGGTHTAKGSVDLTALDPGGTPAIGSPAPTIRTPTANDVGGLLRAVTTDPNPDPRLSRTSTADALAGHRPFVLVVDSPKFRVSPACGKAVIMARYLADRWPDVAFIHLEPYSYTLVADTPVLSGTLANPTLGDAAAAWGAGSEPWGSQSMPWLFVVDDQGIVRAKYQGLMGTDDADVILSLLAAS